VSLENDPVAWEQRYQLGEIGWDRGISSVALKLFFSRFKPGGSVLVPGCGRGHEVVELVKSNYTVTAIDISRSAITFLESQLALHSIEAKLIQHDFFDWSPSQPFDVIYEQTSLCAIPVKNRKRYAKKLYDWLAINGQLFIMFMQTEVVSGPPFHCDIKEMHALFPSDLWQWEDLETSISLGGGKFEKMYVLTKCESL